jgi:uncharacterized membrane protein YsdA (DUF1294 family)
MSYVISGLGWVSIASLATFALFALDKWRARRGLWRVPEAQLLLFAACGGSPGAKLAQRMLRHKTRKEPFRSRLNAILLTQVMLVVLLATARLGPGVLQTLRAV